MPLYHHVFSFRSRHHSRGSPLAAFRHHLSNLHRRRACRCSSLSKIASLILLKRSSQINHYCNECYVNKLLRKISQHLPRLGISLLCKQSHIGGSVATCGKAVGSSTDCFILTAIACIQFRQYLNSIETECSPWVNAAGG